MVFRKAGFLHFSPLNLFLHKVRYLYVSLVFRMLLFLFLLGVSVARVREAGWRLAALYVLLALAAFLLTLNRWLVWRKQRRQESRP